MTGQWTLRGFGLVAYPEWFKSTAHEYRNFSYRLPPIHVLTATLVDSAPITGPCYTALLSPVGRYRYPVGSSAVRKAESIAFWSAAYSSVEPSIIILFSVLTNSAPPS